MGVLQDVLKHIGVRLSQTHSSGNNEFQSLDPNLVNIPTCDLVENREGIGEFVIDVLFNGEAIRTLDVGVGTVIDQDIEGLRAANLVRNLNGGFSIVHCVKVDLLRRVLDETFH